MINLLLIVIKIKTITITLKQWAGNFTPLPSTCTSLDPSSVEEWFPVTVKISLFFMVLESSGSQNGNQNALFKLKDCFDSDP